MKKTRKTSDVCHDGISDENVVRRTPIPFKDGRARPTAYLGPLDPGRVEELADDRSIERVRRDHPADEVVECLFVVRVDHERGRLAEFAVAVEREMVAGLGATRPLLRRRRRRSRTPVAEQAPSDDRGALAVVVDRARAGRDGVAARVPPRVAGGAPGQAGHVAHVSGPQLLPRRPVLGKLDVAGDLEHDEAQGEDIGRLVVLSHEDLRSDVFAVPFALDAGLGRPLGGHAEIGNLEDALERDQNVGWLQVEMDEPAVVHVLDSL